jgi:Zn-dependent M28 family amino/carboxypeptidase
MDRRPLALRPLLVLALPLTLVGCGGPEPDPAAVMTEASLAGHVRVLASDAFEGRSPASLGEARTIRYLTERFRALGLRPGNHGSWTQDVPLVGIATAPGAALEVEGAAVPLRFVNGLEAVMFSKRVAPRVALERSEMVFVGHGVTAPEVGWDDFKGVDVRGKTLVMLVNDPDFAASASPQGGAAPASADGGDAAPGAFGGKRMTYYGRWTYKYEEAARRGAAGVLLVHDDAAAGYDWGVVTGSWSGEQFDLASADGNAGRAAVEGWLRRDAATALFAAAGQDLATLERAAQRRDFQPVPLGLKATVALEQTVRSQASRNVVALLPGSERPDEYLVYMAHWDHLGTDPTLPGDPTFNGAVDNATGTGALLELAAAFAALEPRPARSIVFLAVTAEESGLLGSQHYGSEPVFPLARTVAAINIDSMNIDGPTRDVTVIGRGASELEDVLERAARAQGRVLTDEPSPEKGYFYRSDHFNFAKRGVPVIYAEGGVDLVAGGPEAGRAASERYHREAYHKPADELRTGWDLGGALQDLQLYFAVGRELASGDAWPDWREGNEFRAAREASRDQRR